LGQKLIGRSGEQDPSLRPTFEEILALLKAVTPRPGNNKGPGASEA
jgi:hypothetical protein